MKNNWTLTKRDFPCNEYHPYVQKSQLYSSMRLINNTAFKDDFSIFVMGELFYTGSFEGGVNAPTPDEIAHMYKHGLRKDTFKDLFPESETSADLFDFSWSKLIEYSYSTEIDETNAKSWLDTIISEEVNNPESEFYIYG